MRARSSILPLNPCVYHHTCNFPPSVLPAFKLYNCRDIVLYHISIWGKPAWLHLFLFGSCLLLPVFAGCVKRGKENGLLCLLQSLQKRIIFYIGTVCLPHPALANALFRTTAIFCILSFLECYFSRPGFCVLFSTYPPISR